MPSARSRGLLVGAAVVVAIALRLERALRHPDFFEDGHHHWWIAARWLETGVYSDPFAHQVGAIWLPGYHAAVVGILALFGHGNLLALRLASVALSALSVVLVARLAERERAGAGAPAAFLFALFPYDVLMGGMSLPEPLAVALVLVAANVLLHPPARMSRWVGAGALAAACLVRYEAWLVAIALVPVMRERRWVAPAAATASAWTIATLPTGFFASRIYGQLHGELSYHVGVGFVAADALGRLGAFLRIYAPAASIVLLLALVGAWRARGSPLVWLAWLPVGVLLAMIVLAVSSGSVRYLALAAPFLCALAAVALASLRWRATPGIVALVLVAQAGATVAESLYVDRFGILHEPKERAGDWLAGAERIDGRLLVSESPIAAQRSGWPAAEIIGSKLLPATREDALLFLRERGEYVVYVDNPVEKYSFHRLNALFPEMRAGDSTAEFERVYDANAWERDFGAQSVYVYRVRGVTM